MLNEYLKWRRIVWICCHNGHSEATPDERAPSLVVVSFFDGPLMPAHSRSKDGVASLAYVAGIHVLRAQQQTRMAGTSPAMTFLCNLTAAANPLA